MSEIGDDIQKAAAILQRGGVIAYPTETVFGLGCLPENEAALQRIIDIKGRDANKGFILLAATPEQLQPYTADLSQNDWQTITAPQPRATTWIVPASPDLSPLLTGNRNTIAIRITNHDSDQQLCNQLDDAIVSTSANLSGQPPATTAEALPDSLKRQLDFVLTRPCGPDRKPSRIVDLRSGEIIRD